jgi:hypothetical protein
MDVSDATYGVSRTVFKTLVFSDSLYIVFKNEEDIDYDSVYNFIKNQNALRKIIVSNCLTIDLDTNEITLRGYKLSDTMYIVSKETETVYKLINTQSEFHTKDLIARLHHMYITV